MDIERMERMIVQFLHYVSGARDVGEQRDVDLASVIRAAASEAGDGAEVRISTPLPPLRVRGDPLDLQRMVHNLLDNALRHGGGAEVSVHEAGGQALVTVADEGPGMPSEELERVFRPFYRPDYARNSATGGTGLGLAIARAIARAHGGDVTLRNRSPNGLEAEVRLTVLRESAPAEEATAA